MALRRTVALLTFPLLLWSNKDGAQPRKTGGAFPQESVCNECHNNESIPGGSRPNSGPGSITFSVQPYRPGEAQRITVTVADPTATQIRWGFQLTARPANALTSQAGSFRAVDSFAQVICDVTDRPAPCATPATLQFPTHTLAGTRRGTRPSASFEVEWTAPNPAVGDIIFAAAGNAANGNDLERGDNIYTRQLTVSPAGTTPTPRISANGIVGGGLSTPPVTQISPNGLISIFGENFAPAGLVREVQQADLVDGKLPTKLNGVCVQVGEKLARMFHVIGPNQLNIQVPTLSISGNVPVQVTTNCGAADEAKSNIETVTLQAVAPQFFLFSAPRGDGSRPIAARNAVTGGLVGAADLFPPSSAPAKPGDFVALYSTGFGVTNPAVEDGVLPTGIAATAQPVTVTIGGTEVTPQYAGVAPFFAGLYQINIQIPESAPDGDLSIVARIGGVSTPAGAFLTVKR